MQRLKVLDCTFRDGGYKTGWRFDTAQVNRHLAGTAADIVEIGYRAADRGDCGEYRACSDEHLGRIHAPDHVRLAVMVNGTDWVPGLFKPRDQSRIDIVRVAAHLEGIAKAEDISKELRDLGYCTTINIMQSHRAPDSVFDREYPTDVVYFADSFGCMSARQVGRIVDRLKQNNVVGFHGHNNTKRGLSNTLSALRHGATWLDASVNGIGRGAGNTDLAELLTVLGRPVGDNLYDLDLGETPRSRVVFYCGALLKMHPKRVERWA